MAEPHITAELDGTRIRTAADAFDAWQVFGGAWHQQHIEILPAQGRGQLRNLDIEADDHRELVAAEAPDSQRAAAGERLLPRGEMDFVLMELPALAQDRRAVFQTAIGIDKRDRA